MYSGRRAAAGIPGQDYSRRPSRIPTHLNPFSRASAAVPAKLIKPKRFTDARGWFSETYSAQTYAALGVTVAFRQDNHSMSGPAGVLRGLHFQRPPHVQAKLVRCVRGAIWDVAVDLRKGSPTFGQFVAAELTAENGWQLFVPPGFAHGFSSPTLRSNTRSLTSMRRNATAV
jgi:dTDP-4-dehydrorhamnose 3,5-epimerase